MPKNLRDEITAAVDDFKSKQGGDRLAFLDAVAKNSSLPKNLRDEITAAVDDFKRAENRALDSFGETAEKYAETDDDKKISRQSTDHRGFFFDVNAIATITGRHGCRAT